MIRMFVRHPVTDFATWKQAYDSFDAERKTMGAMGESVFQAVDDPNDVTAWHDFETLDTARSFVESSRLREVMDQAGVTAKPSVWFTTPA